MKLKCKCGNYLWGCRRHWWDMRVKEAEFTVDALQLLTGRLVQLRNMSVEELNDWYPPTLPRM